MKLYNTEWIDIFTNMRAESMADDWNTVEWNIVLIERDVETDDGLSVNDVSMIKAKYDNYEYDETQGLSKVMEQFVSDSLATEKHIKEYKTDKGVERYLIKLRNEWSVDGVIIR